MRCATRAAGLGHVLVDKPATEDAGSQAADDGEREGSGRNAQGDTADEDDGLETFTQSGDKGQQEHGVFFCPALEAAAKGTFDGILGFESLRELDAPFVLEFGDAEQGGTHKSDDDGGDEAKGALPDVFCAGEVVFAEGIEGADDAASNDETYSEAAGNAPPDLGP